jgi:hypothetical protein
VPAHLGQHYGIRVTATTKLMAGVYKVEQHEGPAWVARMFLIGRPVERAEEDAEVLRFLQRCDIPASVAPTPPLSPGSAAGPSS